MKSNEILELDTHKEVLTFIEDNKDILLFFSAPWCPPCRAMEGTLLNTAFELSGRAKVLKVDPYKHIDLASRYNVKGVPTYVCIVNSEVVEVLTGIQPIDKLTNSY